MRQVEAASLDSISDYRMVDAPVPIPAPGWKHLARASLAVGDRVMAQVRGGFSWRGRHLVVGFAGGPIPSLAANLPLLKGAALVGVDVRQSLLHEAGAGAACLAELLAWVDEGSPSPPAGREFAFEEFAPAMEYALSGQGLGKTILRVDDSRGASR